MRTQHQRKFTLKLITLSLTIALILYCGLIQISPSWSGTTGKLKGKITDANTGEPVVAVNIAEKDSLLFGASTDLEGKYQIENIPPGKYDLKIWILCYHTVIVEDIEIKADSTYVINIGLPQVKPIILKVGY